MAKYLDKWKDLFPDTVGGTTRPSEAVSDQEEFNTNGFPQFIAQDPVNYALQNAFLKQFLSNDAWLLVKQQQANQALDKHKGDAQAHPNGISGNAASATKLRTPRALNLSGAVTADAATFDGTADVTINVKTLDASKLKGTTSVSTTGNAATATKLAAARTIALSGNASGSTTFDGSGNATINATVNESAHAATATKVVATAAAGASANIAEASMASNDLARIRVSSATNAGELALETADDGSEPIVARQYTGTYTTPVRTAKILDESGNTSFPGTVVAPKFTGALNGNAATATKLQTARALSLTGKAAGSATFDGSSNAAINVKSVNADTASKLSTARKINITGNATGAANFDGSGDVNISVTVNESKHAAAATTVNATAPNGGAADLAFGTMAVNDYARIRVYGKDDNGALEIATADSGNEPIYARQYSGAYDWPNGRPGTVVNEAAILDGNGNTKFPKNVTAASFTGPLNGNASTADRAKFLQVTEGDGRIDDGKFYWVGKDGQPMWLWGSNTTPSETYVYNPSNFHVAAANNDGNGANIANTYLKKAGDTATGKITFNSTDLDALPEVRKTSDDNMSGIRFSSKSKFLGAVGKRLSNGEDLLNLRSDNTTTDIVLDSRNYGNYALPKSGGTMTGALNFVNNTWNLVGDDSYMGDHDIGGTFCIKGANGETGIALVNKANEADYARISYGGGNINFNKTIGGNITGNASTATNADKVDGYHASDLLSKMQGVLPKTAAEVGQFRELVVNDSHQIKLLDGGTWAYFVYTYNSWSGDDSNNEHRTRTGAGIAAGGTVLHTDGSITSNTINAFKLSGTAGAGGADGADGNNIIVGGFCWRIA